MKVKSDHRSRDLVWGIVWGLYGFSMGFCMELVRSWIKFVETWYRLGMEFQVWTRYGVGMEFVETWYGVLYGVLYGAVIWF